MAAVARMGETGQSLPTRAFIVSQAWSFHICFSSGTWYLRLRDPSNSEKPYVMATAANVLMIYDILVI
ncbi:Hypothetical predicted protein [Octopus vulgaris]|uniref:Uncharacterized protein n=1 Tax=Octopus vulgaris TaxID=6645 RepID=A0AA36AS20_OCTVU|nr:Hypothetical predicted protein [Octopus vulgaris]